MLEVFRTVVLVLLQSCLCDNYNTVHWQHNTFSIKVGFNSIQWHPCLALSYLWVGYVGASPEFPRFSNDLMLTLTRSETHNCENSGMTCVRATWAHIFILWSVYVGMTCKPKSLADKWPRSMVKRPLQCEYKSRVLNR